MSGPHAAFFYGTLVIKDLYTFTPAVLHDYTRHRVQFADYPGMIPEKGGSVLGVYATGLTDANVVKLDFFEGSEYEKKVVTVKVRRDNGTEEDKQATAYIYKHPDNLDRREWSFEEFRKEKMHIWTRESYVFEGCDDYAEFEKDDGKQFNEKEAAAKQVDA